MAVRFPLRQARNTDNAGSIEQRLGMSIESALWGTVGPLGSLEVANRTQLIGLKSAFGISALRDRTIVSGSGSVSESGPEVRLESGATTGSEAIFDSSDRGRYFPGYAGLAAIGLRVDGPQPSGTGRIEWGYLDDSDGVGFGYDSGGLFVFVRRGGSEVMKTYQSAWDKNRLDGTGDEGVTLDLSKGYVFQVEFTWFGYGAISWQIVVPDAFGDQRVLRVHSWSPSGAVAVNEPNLPLRVRVDNGDSTDALSVYVAGRKYEVSGNFLPNRRITSVFREGMTLDGTWRPVLSVRAKSGFAPRSIKLDGLDFISELNFTYEIWIAPNLTGAVWGTPDRTDAAETAIERDLSATARTGGNRAFAGLGSGGGGAVKTALSNADLPNFDLPTNDPLTVVARRLSTASGTGNFSVIARFREEW